MLFGLAPGAALSKIIGSDERVPMLSESMPWSAIGKLTLPDGSLCTASLVARDIILTSAQCLVAQDTGKLHHLEDKVIFAPNFKNGTADHQAHIVSVWLGSRRPHDEISGDYAFARLSAPLGDLYGSLQVRDFSGSTLNSYGPRMVAMPSYSYDFNNAQTAGVHMNCSIRRAITTSYRSKVLLAHDCDMDEGTSGAPLLSFIGNDAVIIGLAVATPQFDVAEKNGVEHELLRTHNLGVTTQDMSGLYSILSGEYDHTSGYP